MTEKPANRTPGSGVIDAHAIDQALCLCCKRTGPSVLLKRTSGIQRRVCFDCAKGFQQRLEEARAVDLIHRRIEGIKDVK